MIIKSNTYGKLKKIREGSIFSNELMFVKEFLQNAQRGKVKNLFIEVKRDSIKFSDDGIGCKNPDNVFTLDKSDWSTTNEGFGIGFWSCLALEELCAINVISRKWRARVDVDNLFKNEDLSVEKEDLDEHYKGFEILLECSDMNYYKIGKIEDEIRDIAKYLNFNVYSNGSLVEKVDIFEDVQGDFVKKIDNQLFKAVISISDSSYGRLDLFYDRRKVDRLYGFDYVVGVVEPKKGKITLKEPDRTDYIHDENFDKFQEKLEKEIKELYKDLLKSNVSDELLNVYAESIDKYLDVREYEKFLMSDFELENNKKESEIEESYDTSGFIRPAINIKRNEVSYVGFNNGCNDSDDCDEGQEYVSSLYCSQTENNLSECACSEASVEKIEIPKYKNKDINENSTEKTISKLDEDADFDVSDFDNDDYRIIEAPISHVLKENKQIKEKSFKNIAKSTKNMVWVATSDVDLYSDAIALAEYCNLVVYKAKNILFEKVLKEYGKLHVADLKDSLIEIKDRKNIGLKNKKEESFIKLLMPICKKYRLPVNIFNIANLEQKTELKLNGKVVYKKSEKNSKNKIYVQAISTGVNIIFDRNYLNLSRFSISGEDKFGINELKTIMFVSKIVAHELAHHLYGTIDNTVEHYKIEAAIYDEILELYI